MYSWLQGCCHHFAAIHDLLWSGLRCIGGLAPAIIEGTPQVAKNSRSRLAATDCTPVGCSMCRRSPSRFSSDCTHSRSRTNLDSQPAS